MKIILNKDIELHGIPFRVYSDGTIIRLRYTSPMGNRMKERVAKLRNQDGYLNFDVRSGYRKQKKYRAHRVVAECFLENPNSLEQIDHIDGNKSNNSVENLRWVSVTDNLRAFREKKRGTTSKYRGVYKKETRWVAQVGHLGERVRIGSFGTEEEAAHAYDAKAIQLGYLKEALNFPRAYSRS